MKAQVYVTLKQEVLDPQGDAVRQALGSLGYPAIANVRVGKLITIDLGNATKAEAEKNVRAMCEKLLANPVMEDFRFDIVD